MAFVSTLFLISLPLILIYLIIKSRKNLVNRLDELPGPPSYPLIGNNYLAIGLDVNDTHDLMRKVTDQYKPLFRTWLGGVGIVHLTKPEHVEVIFHLGIFFYVINNRNSISTTQINPKYDGN